MDSRPARIRRPAAIRVLSTVLLGVMATGCGTVNSLREAPLDAGLTARYHAPLPEVVNLLPGAYDATDLGVTLDDRGGRPPMLIGGRGWNLLDWGFLVRAVAIEMDAQTEVRVATRKRLQTQFFMTRHDRAALDLVASLDRALGPERIAPFEGMWVRGTGPDGAEVEGPLELDGRGRYGIEDAGPLATLDDLEVRRGSVGRGAIGALLGSIAGAVVGNSLVDDSAPTIGDAIENQFEGLLIGAAVGGLVGKLLGDLIRTETWSPMTTNRD